MKTSKSLLLVLFFRKVVDFSSCLIHIQVVIIPQHLEEFLDSLARYERDLLRLHRCPALVLQFPLRLNIKLDKHVEEFSIILVRRHEVLEFLKGVRNFVRGSGFRWRVRVEHGFVFGQRGGKGDAHPQEKKKTHQLDKFHPVGEKRSTLGFLAHFDLGERNSLVCPKFGF